MKRFYLAGFLVVVLTVMDAAAQQYFKDGPSFGIPTGGNIQQRNAAIGYQVAYVFEEIATLELSLTRQTDDLNKQLNETELPSDVAVDMEMYALALTAQARYEVTDIITAYAGGGVGYYHFKTDAARVSGDTQFPGVQPSPGMLFTDVNIDVNKAFGYHGAVGLEFRLSRNWEIFTEYRLVHLNPDIDVEYHEESPTEWAMNTLSNKDKLNYDYGLFRIGLNYCF